jgi:DAK2 domain fusion protein YloV
MKALNGHDLRGAFSAATCCLERYRDLINALNVFPVPDGDTGTNMLLTMRSGMEKCADDSVITVGQASAQLADGTFWEARGNSGVILSQFFRGFADALKDAQVCRVPELKAAFRQASEAAYQAVGKPVEGTMLSVIRAVAEGVEGSGSPDVVSVWQTAFTAAKDALARTPSQLPVLREAGVVDAGGMGMVAIIGGVCCYLSGQDVERADLGIETMGGRVNSPPLGASFVDRDFLDASHDSIWGYCTQFLIEGEALVQDEIREGISRVADSVVVVGYDRHLKVHVHALDPGPALSYGVSLGQLSQIKIENMSLQNRGWSGGACPPGSACSGVTVVAVVPGGGLAQMFRQTGCASVIQGGQTMNPSVRQILEAAERSGCKDIIILPNNKNVVVAAEQAALAASGGRRLHVLATRSVPQGVAALLAFNPEESPEHNLAVMRAAMEGVVTVEVTRAVRDTSIGDLPAPAGQFIALADGQLTVSDGTAEGALCCALARVGLPDGAVVTLYWGSGSTKEQAQAVADELAKENPGIQVEVFYGGQPHYPYLASIE